MSRSPKRSLSCAFAILTLLSSGCTTFDFLGAPPDPSKTSSATSAASSGSDGGGGMASATSSGSGGGGGMASTASSGSGAIFYELVDDMEDGTLAVTLPHWQGKEPPRWYITNDGTGKLTSPMNGLPEEDLIQFLPMVRGSSRRGIYLGGNGFTDYGADAALGVYSWDVSGFTGIKFWARTDTTACNYAVLLEDVNTTKEGRVCTTCFDGFLAKFKYTSEWKQYTVAFDVLHQEGWGIPQEGALNKTALWLIIFRALPNCSFNMWIDDVELYRE